MAELEKTILNVPNLPNHIQGDGRYLISLLKSFLEQTAEQVNLANGFSAEDIQAETEGAVQTPRNFFLSFTRLGGEFSWSHINDIASLAYYELRTDKNIGDDTGLLERTVNNSSTKMSVNAIDTVYLYAFNRDGEYSNPAELVYSKPRPDAPTNIAITKSADGSLISFSEIPTNCIGANIYIDGVTYTSYDNIYIFKGNLSSGNIDTIEVAFFDDFGDGEAGVLYLTLPDVTGLLVERNNSELDFYWNPLNIYNIKYVVKVCNELSWEKGTELFRTATNDKNRILYPNSGTYYLMVKAYDENGNYSKNASYQLMTTPIEIDKNIILENNQQDLFFSGNKINLYYDPVLEGVTLEREAFVGEYLFDVSLLQKYRARNWLEADTAVYVTDNNVVWDDALFNWDSAEQPWAGIIGNADGITVKQQISTYKGLDEDDAFVARLDGKLVAETGEEPLLAIGADDYRSGRWLQGLQIDQTTKLAYKLANVDDTFSLVFNLRITAVLPDTVLLVLETDNGEWLRLGYTQSDNKLKLVDSNGVSVDVDSFISWSVNTKSKPTFKDSTYRWHETLSTFGSVFNHGAISDWLTLGITQSEDTRKVFIYSYNEQLGLQGEVSVVPLGRFTGLYCYPKLT